MYSFWTHGVEVILEFPERAAVLRRAGWGTLVEQAPDPPGRSNNWFHFALHTPKILSETERADFSLGFRPARPREIRVVADVNLNARISEVHLRYGDRLVVRRAVDLRGPHIDYVTNVNEAVHEWLDTGLVSALALCVRVEFGQGDPRGQITFRLGGVSYP